MAIGLRRVPVPLTALAAVVLAGCAPAPLPTPQSADRNLRRDYFDPNRHGQDVVLRPVADDRPVLQGRLDTVLSNLRRRQLDTTHAFWTLFHGVLAFGPSLAISNPDHTEEFPALDYMLSGSDRHGRISGLGFFPTPHGLAVQMGPAYEGQGHQDQFAAIMAQYDVPAATAVLQRFTVRDIVDQILANARVSADPEDPTRQELSWTLIVVGHYVGTDAHWTNAAGQELTYEDLVAQELHDTIDRAACGGTHRLYGLTNAYHMHKRGGGPMTPLWQEVGAVLERHQAIARENQLPSGAFSTAFFSAKQDSPDLRERLNSHGHTVEWLSQALSSEELSSEWMQRAMAALVDMFLEVEDQSMESGALYHAAHGIVIYYQRQYDLKNLRLDLPEDDNPGLAGQAPPLAP